MCPRALDLGHHQKELGVDCRGHSNMQVVRKENRLDRDGDEERKGEGKGRRSEQREEKRRFPLRAHPLPSGPTCSEEVTVCHSEPCLNGGSCSPRPGGYSCTCLPSHTGPHCQTSTDHCASGECPPCPGVGPKEDGGPGQGVFVPYFKKKKNPDTASWCSDGGGGVLHAM